jgi:hypothetical protein
MVERTFPVGLEIPVTQVGIQACMSVVSTNGEARGDLSSFLCHRRPQDEPSTSDHKRGYPTLRLLTREHRAFRLAIGPRDSYSSQCGELKHDTSDVVTLTRLIYKGLAESPLWHRCRRPSDVRFGIEDSLEVRQNG